MVITCVVHLSFSVDNLAIESIRPETSNVTSRAIGRDVLIIPLINHYIIITTFTRQTGDTEAISCRPTPASIIFYTADMEAKVRKSVPVQLLLT